MPFNGSGTFTPAITFVDNTLATAEDQNTQDVDFASGLTDCVTRDGQSPATANLSMGGFKLNNLGTPVAGSDAATLASVTGVVPTSANIIAGLGYIPVNKAGDTITGALTINGATTVPTVTTSDNSTNAASTANVTAKVAAEAAILTTALSLPAQTGLAGQGLTTNGTAASWTPMVVSAQAGLVTNAGTASPTVTFARNVSSVTRTGAGVWAVVLTGLNNANYTVSISGSDQSGVTSLIPVYSSSKTST